MPREAASLLLLPSMAGLLSISLEEATFPDSGGRSVGGVGEQ